jgi:hypothetical protein
MKYILLPIACLFSFTKIFAQTISSDDKGLGPLNSPMISTQYTDISNTAWNSRIAETGASFESRDNVTGTLFFTEEYNKGYILLDGNRLAKNVPLRFNVYTSQVFFKKDSQVLVLDAAVPIVEFGYWDSGQGKAIVFRRGYPDIANFTGKTFYEVVQYGKLSLLEQHGKRIVEKRDIHGVPQKVITDAEAWFVYDVPGNKMIGIKHNKNSLLEALPEYSNAIQSILQDKKLKLRSDEDWLTLFKELNNYFPSAK